LLQDILPARLLVLEFATKLAAHRAAPEDVARIRDITELLITAFDRGDPVVLAHGFQRWLDALIEAGHSVAVRWIANPFVDAYRELLDRFPALWVLEPSFPQHLRDVASAIEQGKEEEAVNALRNYYQRVDRALMQTLSGVMKAKGP
jgi:DNA-binding GntR family transcriptional regulator